MWCAVRVWCRVGNEQTGRGWAPQRQPTSQGPVDRPEGTGGGRPPGETDERWEEKKNSASSMSIQPSVRLLLVQNRVVNHLPAAAATKSGFFWQNGTCLLPDAYR